MNKVGRTYYLSETDHLGNVRVTFSDRKEPQDCDNLADGWVAVATSVNNYYSFGMLQPGRNWNAGNYRFGFNGQEMDNEISGQTGTHTTAEFWEYDARLGRRWNLDPKPFVGVSEYACLGDNPIWFRDVHGDIIDPASDQDKEKVDQTFDDTFGATSETSKLLKGSYSGTNNNASDPTSMVDGYKNYISNKDLRKAMRSDNLSKDQKAVAVGYQKAINNKKIILITFVSDHTKSDAKQMFKNSWNNKSFSNKFVNSDIDNMTKEGVFQYQNEVTEGTNYVALILVYTGTSEDIVTVDSPSPSGSTQTNYSPKLTTSSEFKIAAALMTYSISMNGYLPSPEEQQYINQVARGEKSSDSNNVPSYFTIDE